MGAVKSPASPLPCRDPGRGSHLPLGPASPYRRASRAGPPRALPGEKEKPCTPSARAHPPPPLQRTAGGEAGLGRAPSSEGPGGGGGEPVKLPSRALKGTPNADWRAAGGGHVPGGVGGRGAPSPGINYCLGFRVPARTALGTQRPPSRPHPQEKELKGRPAQEGSAGCLGVRGPELQGGRLGKGRCVPSGGGGQVTADGGRKAREDRWGKETGREPRRQEKRERPG